MQPVDGVGGHLQGGGEAERVVGADDVVVDGLGQVDDVETGLVQFVGVLGGSATTKCHQGVQAELVVVVDDGRHHVRLLAIDDHAIDLVTAGSQDRPAHGEDAGEVALGEVDVAVLRQAQESVMEADEFHAVLADGRLAEATDCCVEAGAVSPGGENADSLVVSHASSRSLTPSVVSHHVRR